MMPPYARRMLAQTLAPRIAQQAEGWARALQCGESC